MEVDAAKIAAQFENGVLIVRVPKAVKAAALRIPIGAVDTVIEGSADPINSDRYLVRDVQVQ